MPFPDTIPELRSSWSAVEGLGLEARLHRSHFPATPPSPLPSPPLPRRPRPHRRLPPSTQAVGVLFFKRIFEIAPGALELFSFRDVPAPELYESAKLKSHALKVMNTVGVAVSMLDDVPALLPVLEGLGKKHVDYGVVPAHYEVVGQALLDTLALGLGDAFTPELKAAWAEIYGVVSSTMIKGANKVPAPAYTEHGSYATHSGADLGAIKDSQANAESWYTSPDCMPQSVRSCVSSLMP